MKKDKSLKMVATNVKVIIVNNDSSMKKREKEALVKLLGGLGLIILLIGLFTNLYDFIHGLIAAIAIWILTGVVSKYLGVEKK